MAKTIRVGVTHGDYNGVGYDVISKSLADEQMLELVTPVVFGNSDLLRRAAAEGGVQLSKIQDVASAAQAREGVINVVEVIPGNVTLSPGHPDKASGAAAVKALEAAVEAIKAGDIDVMVTAPICKEAVQSNEFHFPGHTEYLNARAGEEYKALMILFAGRLRVALVTTHVPLHELSSHITQESVFDHISRLDSSLRKDFGVDRPKIAVLGLNPHCGDGGLIGKEEGTAIIPAIKQAEEKGILAFGPYSADAFFATPALCRRFDGVLAMYHDQGLAPFKALAGHNGVNFTAGLPFVRTSPDHGTANDLAWTGEAEADSMRQAIYEAVDIFRTRSRYMRATRNPLRKAPVAKEKTSKPEN